MQKGAKVHMQYYLNVFLKGLPVLALLFFVISTIFLIISHAKIVKEKRLNKELLEYINCKDEVLEEFKKIRHDYNNMLQTLTCFIEEEDMNGLNEYKSKLLQKTHLLNKNSLTQMAKIKDKSILRTVYKLFLKSKENGITLNLTIYNDITEISSYKAELYYLLQNYLNHAYELAVNSAMKINLKISANDMGLNFCFECTSSAKSEVTSKPIKFEKSPIKGKNIFYNTSIQNEQLIQEILVNFN